MSIAARDDHLPLEGATMALATRHKNLPQACFDTVLKLSQPQSPTEFGVLYAHLRGMVEELLQHPGAAGLAAQDARDIAYAIAALADEKALQASAELAAFWLPRRLQMVFFDDNMAGEGFFERLDALRQQPGRQTSLQAYYLALALGFEGRYGRSGGEPEIVALMASLRQTLVAQATLRPEALAGYAVPQASVAAPTRWHRTPAAAVAAGAAAAFLLWGAMAADLRAASARVVAMADAVAPGSAR